MESPLILPQISHPVQTREYIIVLLGIGVLLGFYFSQDQPQALQTYLQSNQLNFQLTSTQFNLIYFITMFPNVFLNVIGGMIIDKVGVIRSVVLFGFFIFLAQSMIAFSIYWKQTKAQVSAWYIILLIGRGIFGVAGQNTHTVVSAIVSIVIPPQRLSTGLGICLSLPFIFGALNSLVSTSVYKAVEKLYIPFAIGSGACFLSFLITIITAVYFRNITKKSASQFIETGQQLEDEKIQCSKITKLGSTFWLLMILCCNMAGLWYGFLDNSLQCLESRFNIQNDKAGKLVMIPYIVCAFLCPIYGYISTKFLQKRRFLILSVPIICTVAHIIIFLLPNLNTSTNFTEPSTLQYAVISIFFVLLGCSFSGYVSMIVPSISMVVDQKILGTAFGLAGTANALSQSFFPMISAFIIESISHKIIKNHPNGDKNQIELYAQGQGYKYNSIFYIFMGGITILVAFILYISKNKQARQLDAIDVQVDEIDWVSEIAIDEVDSNFAISFNIKKKDMTLIEQKSVESQVTQQIIKQKSGVKQTNNKEQDKLQNQNKDSIKLQFNEIKQNNEQVQ